MKNVFVIHGAWSSRRGFKYIERNINYDNIDEFIMFKYDCNEESLYEIIARAKIILKDSGKETIILGHSLGGLIALALHDEPNCHKLVTLSTPFSGIEIPSLLEKIFAIRAPIILAVASFSPFIKNLHKKNYSKNIHSFISTSGYNPLILDKSDGIVTIRSQEDWLPESAISTYVNCNHFEILQRDEVVAAINRYSE